MILTYMKFVTSTWTGEDDLADVADNLQSLEKKDIYMLGLRLGISHSRLMEKYNSELFLNEMLYFWLTLIDRVAEMGTPSWETLAKALEHHSIGQTGLGNKIIKHAIHCYGSFLLCMYSIIIQH